MHLITIKNSESEDGTFKRKELLCYLTKKGRSEIKVVLVGGVFDLLHVGHIHTLKSAKLLGDVLVIVGPNSIKDTSNLKNGDKVVIKLRN